MGDRLLSWAGEISSHRDPASRTTLSPGLRELIQAGVIARGTRVWPKRGRSPGEGVIQGDGTIAIDGESLSPAAASNRVSGYGI